MDFIYLFRVLLKRKWIIIGAAFLAAAMAWWLTRDEPRNYKSSAQLSTGFSDVEVIKTPGAETDPWHTDDRFNNTIHSFTSEPVLSLISYRLILHDLTDPNPFRQLNAKQKESPAYRNINLEEAKKAFQTKLDSMGVLTSFKPEERKLLDFLSLYGYDYRSLNKNVSVFRVNRTDYLQIDFLSDNPELSAFVVNDLFSQFQRYFTTTKSTINKGAIDTLRNIMERKRQEVQVKNAMLGNSSDFDPTLGSSSISVAGTLREKVQDMNLERGRKVAELSRINTKLSLIGIDAPNKVVNNGDLLVAQKAANEAYSAYLQNPGDKSLEDKYNRLDQEYKNKLRQYNASNENGSTSSTRPKESKEDLEDRKASLQLDINQIDASISLANGQINQLESKVDAGANGQQFRETLKKERDQAQQEYLAAAADYNKATTIEGSSVNGFRLFTAGQPAIAPEPSKRTTLIMMAGAAAFVITILIIIFLTYLDTSIKTPIIFSKSVNLKLISLVNFMDLRNKKIEDIVSNKSHSETIIDRNKFNAFRESIRKLRYEIEHTGKKVFLFTSTKKGQGKTTLIQALSYSMSLSKKKILIIDTNFCNPDLTVQLNADPILEKITPYKANGTTLVDQVKKYSKDVGLGTVYAIGAEGGDYTPSEILPRENLLHHLQSLTSEFDYIFLEGPPLNDFSDSKELAQYVDGVIAVFSATHIIKQIDKQSIAFFKELNGKFCGSILNMVDLKNVNVT